MDNIIEVQFNEMLQRTRSIWQYDYGQVLKILSGGVVLPNFLEVHFSLSRENEKCITRIGTTVNGVTEVQIPNELLNTENKTHDYFIYAFIYVSTEKYGNTKCEIIIPVKSRIKPENPSEEPLPEPNIFHETVEAVNAAADRAKMAERNAKENATEAGKYAASASESAVTAEKTKEDALRKVGEKKREAIEAIQNQATDSKAELEQTITNADASKKELEHSIETAGTSKTALDKSVELAGTAKTELDTSILEAGTAKTALDESTETAGTVQETLSATVKQAGALDTSLGENIETGTQLKTDLTASGEKAVQDIQAAGSEQLGKMQAVAEEFTAEREQIATNKEDIGSLKEDISELNTSVFEVKESPNIFDKTKINQDKGLVTWGTPTMSNYTYDKTGWVTSYPIAVHGGSTIHTYKFENGGIRNQDITNLITFAKDGSFIALEGRNKNEIKLSENTAYIIFDISNLTFIDSLMLTTEPYNGVYQEYGRKKVDKVAKIADDVSKINSDKTHIIFSFDAFKIDNRFELMKSYGFPFTIAIAQTILTYPISKDDYYNYFVDGNVDFSVYAGKGNRPADYRSDKDKWSAWVKELVDGLKETSGLYYPVMYSCQNGASSDILNQVVKENGFRMCRNGTYYNADGTTTYGVLTDRKYLIDGTKYFDYYPLSVVKQEGYPTVEQIKAEIDNAIEKKKSIMLFTHYVIDDTQTMSDTDCPLSKFTAVLDYVKEKVDVGLCDVKNARQFWNYYNQQDGLDIDYKRTNMRNLFDTTH